MKTILFDLDGTLLPMDQEIFTNTYFKLLSAKMQNYGYEPSQLIKAVWQGTFAMVTNDGKKTNEEVFWDVFSSIFGNKVYRDKELIDSFYSQEFNQIQKVCGYSEKTRWLIDEIKKLNAPIVLATNPIFPRLAQENRIKWAGLDPCDFIYYTSYENMHYSKPNLKYYQEILTKLSLNASDVIMVGNDVDEDMVAKELGIEVFLLTPCLINKSHQDINNYPHGDFDDLFLFIKGKLLDKN